MKKLISVLCVTALMALMAPPVHASAPLRSTYIGATNYLSDEMRTKAQFSGLIVEYEQEASADDYIDFLIRFDEGNEWSEWVPIRPDHDHSDHDDDHGYEVVHHEDHDHEEDHESEHNESDELHQYLINTNMSKGYQIYVDIVDGRDDIKPKLKIKKLSFINAKAGAPKVKTGAFQIDSSPNVISRSEWGADEDLLYGSSIDVTDDEHEDIDRVEYEDNGRELKWPRQYMDDVKMMVVHHTASVNDLDDPKQAIRNIYYYHTVRRGWGDIGYNYIVDTDGRIYEGRSGGEKVVGGHSVKVNKASIGIAVLGNYQTQDVPKDVIHGLTNILTDKADKYDLDVLDDVEYSEKDYPVLGGHRDSSSTACPGENLYRALPTVRYLVSGAEVYEDRTKLSRWRYAYVDEEPLKDMLDLELGETKQVSITLENVGKKSWNTSNTYLRLNNHDEVKDVVRVNSSKVAKLSSTVRTGQEATFNFDVTGGLGTGFHGLELSLVMNGTVQADLPIIVPLYLDNDFSFDVSGKDSFTLNMRAGETDQISVKFKNTSSIDWNRGYDVDLRPSNGSDSKILSTNDIGSINKGRFKTVSFNIKAPSSSGTYTEYLVPSIDGDLYFDGEPIKVTVKVGGSSTSTSSSSARKTSKPLVLNSSVEVEAGETQSHTIELVNKTNQTWRKSNFRITKLGNRAVEVDNLSLKESTVKPGYAGTIEMDVRANKSGTYKYQLRFYNGKSLVYSTPYRLTVSTDGKGTVNNGTNSKTESNENVKEKVTVVRKVEAAKPQVASGSLGPDIRIHLSVFDLEETRIKAHGLTEVYVDDARVGSITSRSNASVREYNSIKAKVTIDGKTFTGKVIRFVPTSNQGTVTVEDLENRPGWNKSLNDNRYRGVMEFRMDQLELKAINELPLELYLRGVGEVSNGTHEETMKTILIAARSYAYHYITDGEKFRGRPYHLDDSPARSQKYIGYGFEKRSPNVTNAVKDTAGRVVTYEGDVIKVPYFSRSNGRTKSAKEVWGWTNTPYLTSVEDPYCEGQTPAGHGVGISGCGTDGMAKAGSNHEDIIKYFLKGVELAEKY